MLAASSKLVAFVLLLLFSVTASSCGRERCCLLSTCISAYCQGSTSQTWVSSESFTNYGYTKLVLSNNSCLPCPYNCRACSSEDTCSTCATGYYMASSGSCGLCKYGCDSCTVANNISTCTVCGGATYLDSATGQCKNCPSGAATCSSATVIASCQTGYYLTSNSLFCLACPSNCVSCPSSETVCASCATGYYLSSGACHACTKGNCAACSFIANQQWCTTCNSGYFSSAGTCASCEANCLTCASATVCTKCASTHYLSSQDCILIASSVAQCETYSSSTACSTCLQGYHLSSNVCSSCSILCTTCEGIHFGRCTACVSTASLFNMMCLPQTYTSSSNYQVYYSYPTHTGFSGGASDCNHYLYRGTTISLSLEGLAASAIAVQWRVFSVGSTASYTVSLTNSAGTSTASAQQTSSPGLSLCSTDTSSLYYLHISTHTFTSVKNTNTLTFTSSTSLAIQEVLITTTMCNDLCAQCTSDTCSLCTLSSLYTQGSNCVYSCSSGYYLYESGSTRSCTTICHSGSYPLSSNLTCQSCPTECTTCSTATFCLACQSGYFLTPDNTCSNTCPDEQYASNLTSTCQACLGRCRTCLNEQQCLSCKEGFYQASNYSCLDSCTQTSQYADLSTLNCQQCNSSCLSCEGASDRCTACSSPTTLYNLTCLAQCPAGHYPDTNNTCQTCIYPCQSCSIDPTNCTSCKDRYLLNHSCLSDCPAGYFQDNGPLACTVCATGCSQCVGQASYCTQCNNSYYLHENSCLSTCPDFFYGNDTINTCLGCQGHCHTCTNSSECLTCNANFLWQGGCVSASSCPDQYFANVNTLTCDSCSSNCFTCQYSSTTCTGCHNSSSLPFLQSGQCVSQCSDAFYPTNSSNGLFTCSACQSPCVTCSTATYCLSCIDGYMVSNGQCGTSCPPSFFFDTSISSCSACSSECLVCTSSIFCQLCSTNHYISSINSTHNQCLATCPDGNFANSLLGACQSCIYPCQTCSSTLDCLTCQQGALHNSRCLSSCPDTTFLNTTANTCDNCGGNCLTCVSNATQCLSCQTSYFLYTVDDSCYLTCPSGSYSENVTQRCLQCPSTCSECTNSTHCTACISQRTYLYANTSACLSSCPIGFYADTSTSNCLACTSPCLTCTGSSSNCLSCASSFYLVRVTVTQFDCASTCPDGYYTSSSSCTACVFPCQTCSSASQCLTCVTGTYLHTNTSTCLLACPAQSYLNSTTQDCQSCPYPCDSCKNSTYCLSCQSSLHLSSGQCLSSCPDRYYSDSTQLCQPCSGLCNTCSGKYFCLTCLTGYLSSGYCYNTCPAGTYVDLNNTSCNSCTSPCVQCEFNANHCTRCSSGLLVYEGNCYSECPVGSYLSGTQCLSCSFPCTNCSQAGTCYECLGGFLLYNGLSCINDTTLCPNDFYKMDGKFCIPSSQCPSNYVTDTSLRTCSLDCYQQKYRNNDAKTCETACQSYQYVGENMICVNYTTTPAISLMAMEIIAFVRSSVLTLVVVFNQSFVWVNTNDNMYSLILSDSRLLAETTLQYNYENNNPNTLLAKVTPLNNKLTINLPAYYVKSTETNYPLQTPSVTISVPDYLPYDYDQIYQGYTTQQFGEGLGWFILLLTLFFLVKNRISQLYILWDTVQLLFVLIFLDIQYPPALNEFLLGLKTTIFLTFPNAFPAQDERAQADAPFHAYSYDNSFIRNAGPSITLLIIAASIWAFFKVWETLMKHCQKVGDCMSNYPKLKKFLYQMLLRYRWHYVSDAIFMTYLPVCLFAVAQLNYTDRNPERGGSNAASAIFLVLYLLFPLFVAYKLQRHFPNISKGKHSENLRCFYRGIEKTNKFGVFLILIRYFRKLVYCLAIGIFSAKPMYALPILTFCSLLMALFIFIQLPFKKRLSNIVETITELSMSLLFLGLAIINFNNAEKSKDANVAVGYFCTAILIFVLLLLVFQVFCKALFNLESEAEIRKRIEGIDEAELRKKAEEFFDFMFPRVKKDFGFDQDSQDEAFHYEDGDSDDSQNNNQMRKNWGFAESDEAHSEEFRHYDNNSQTQKTTQKSAPPQYLVRCVKDL